MRVNMTRIFGGKNELKVDVNQQDFVTIYKHDFLVF
jgi:hypothetical protein